MTPSRIHVGCCGLQMARGKYFEQFKLLEVQQTFYQPPQIKTLEKWRADAPVDFEYTIKAWQLITHACSSRKTYRRLRDPIPSDEEQYCGRFQLTPRVLNAWQVTLASARALLSWLVIFQCPASFTPTEENVRNLRAFFKKIRHEREGLICGWEPRGDWPGRLILELTGELDLLHVVDPFTQPIVQQNAPLRYFRLHGEPGARYNSTYTDEHLRQLLSWCLAGETYVLFNNIPMVKDARRFLDLIERKTYNTAKL